MCSSDLQSWYGLDLSPDEKKIWFSGGGFGKVHRFQIQDNTIVQLSEKEPDPLKLSRQELADFRKKLNAEKGFKSGLLWDDSRQLLYALNINRGELLAQNEVGEVVKTLSLQGRPYDIKRSPQNGLLYISDWSEKQVLVVDPELFQLAARIPVGIHPNQMA